MSNFQLNRELKGLQSDRETYKNDLKNQQEKYAYFLRNELKRKGEQGLIQPQIVEKTFYKPITNGQIGINALIGLVK